jgi:PEP-CTERM motif
MLRKFLVSVAALSLAGPAAAASFVLTTSTPFDAIPSNNDFQSQLNGLGFLSYTSSGASIAIDGPAQVDFYFFGSESGNDDTFKAAGDVGSVSKTENTTFTAFGPQWIGSIRFNGAVASLANVFNFTSSGSNAAPATVGQGGFGIFLKCDTASRTNGCTTTSTSGNYSTLWFGYDDQLNNVDDNHDDFIIKAVISGIPEASTWGMMIGGMGLAGMALRSRRRKGVAALV